MEMNKSFEIAKSWFVLAQILIILAGFSFTSAGISWSLATSNLNSGVNLVVDASTKSCDNICNLTAYQNLTGNVLSYYAEMTMGNLDLWKYLIDLGLLLTIFSILCWLRGKYLLHRI
ncbi:MAG: hypothetical protein WCX73_04065 [Candidatus Pacearchaeota archaeon]|jgi:hypothetical protein